MKEVVRFFHSRILKILVFGAVAGGFSAVAAEDFVYKYQGRRDPFVPLITPAGFLINLEPADDKKLNVEGIMFDAKGASMAIINGELMSIGDTIGSAVVSAIEANKVIVIQDNEKIELELRRGE
jgi:hypothetical protein